MNSPSNLWNKGDNEFIDSDSQERVLFHMTVKFFLEQHDHNGTLI